MRKLNILLLIQLMLNFTACEWKWEGAGKPFAITGRASYGEYRIDLSSGSDKKEIDRLYLKRMKSMIIVDPLNFVKIS